MKTDPEKRDYHRYEIPQTFLRFKKGDKGTERIWSEGSLMNISKGGLSFACREDINVGDKISSHLYLPHGVCWPLNGVVAWKGENENNEFSVGVKFDRVKSGEEFHSKGINIDAVKRLVALHQAAHIVIAYFLGFTPEYVGLHNNGDGEYKIDFGDKSSVAIPLVVGDISPELFSFVSDMPRDMVFDLAKRICYILIAGGIVENIAKLRSLYIGANEIGLSGADVYRASAIAEHFLIDLTREMLFLYECLKDERLWDPINKLSNDLLESDRNQLHENDIYASLKSSGCYDFLSDQPGPEQCALGTNQVFA